MRKWSYVEVGDILLHQSYGSTWLVLNIDKFEYTGLDLRLQIYNLKDGKKLAYDVSSEGKMWPFMVKYKAGDENNV
jgi:hypothetical protein